MRKVIFVVICTVLCILEDLEARGGGGHGGGHGGGRGGRHGRGRSRIFHTGSSTVGEHGNPGSTSYHKNRDGAKIVKASNFEFEYKLGRRITFFCVARGHPRPNVRWFKYGIELYRHKFFKVREWPLGNYTVKSQMVIEPSTRRDDGFYECQASNKYAIDIRHFRTEYIAY